MDYNSIMSEYEARRVYIPSHSLPARLQDIVEQTAASIPDIVFDGDWTWQELARTATGLWAEVQEEN
jgi:hypothetical protein